VGLVVVAAPFVLGLFAKVAAGAQLLDRFEPLMAPDSLARYDADLVFLRDGASTLHRIGDRYRVDDRHYPGVAAYRDAAPGIDARGSELIGSVRAGTGDFDRLAGIGGFDRVPLLLVVVGLAAVGGGVALRSSDTRGARFGAVVASAAGLGLMAFVLTSGVWTSAAPAQALVDRFGVIMNEQQVRTLQSDFVIVVGAVGEIDTGYPGSGVRLAAADAAELDRLKAGWPQASRDLADLVGQINDNIANYRQLDSLGRLSPVPGVTGWQLLPVFCLVIGAAIVALSVAGLGTAGSSTAGLSTKEGKQS